MNSRYSKQREAILNYLRSVHCHPTADEVFLNVKQQIPNISLGTIYRNLALLAEHGEILVLQNPGAADRFDGNIAKHNHVVCRKCRKVCDIKAELPDEKLDSEAEKSCNYGQIRHTVHFTGICPDCAEKCKRRALL